MKKLFQTWNAYRNAIGAAATSLRHVPKAICSVLLARLGYDIGPYYHSLYQLASAPRERWNDFLIDDKFIPVLKRINSKAGLVLVRDKLAFYHHCRAYDIPTVPVLCTIDRSVEADEVNFVTSLNTVNQDIFVKLIDYASGIGAFNGQFVRTGIWRVHGRNLTSSELYAYCNAMYPGRKGWIVQPRVRNHAEIQPIFSDRALGTVRVVTVRDGERIVPVAAAARIPVGDNPTDNFSHGSTGNLVANVDIRNGVIGQARGSKSRNWPRMTTFATHPNTKVAFEGFQLPFWKDSLRMLQSAHQSFDDLTALGWDLALTDDGPVIVETNGLFAVDILQISQQRGLKHVLNELIPAAAADSVHRQA